MTISHRTFLTSGDDWTSVLSSAEKGYRRAIARHAVHNMLLARYANLSEANLTSKAGLARRMGVDPSQVTRWLSFPRNLTIDTIADLLLAMNATLEVGATEVGGSPADRHIDSAATPRTTETAQIVLKLPEAHSAA